MIAKILDLNESYVLLSLMSGETMSIRSSTVPLGSKVGDSISVNMKDHHTITNDKLIDFF